VREIQVLVEAIARIVVLSAHVCGGGSPTAPDSHVRANDRRMEALIEDAARASSTIHLLISRLDESDTVVYVHQNPDLEGARSGELKFMASSGGWRYVRVELQTRLARRLQIAALGHELRHAVEVAEAPQVVDATSLSHLYERIGYEVARRPRAFESQAAIVAGRQVGRELSGRPPDRCARRGVR
jgi:hypothetical protein